MVLRRSELLITDTELKLIAAAARIGLSSNRNPQSVVDEGEEQVLADVFHGGAAEFAGAHDSSQVALHQRDVCAFNGNVSAGAHGYADVSLGQSGRVVDTV